MWQILPGQSLSHRCWDDEVVLYNNLSGDTHLLSADALALLAALRGGPLSVAQLAQHLAPGENDTESVLCELLAALSSIHLVEHLAP